MQKRIINPAMLGLFLVMIMLQSCLKDSVSLTYRIFSPVYITKSAARNGVKNEAPQPVVSPGKIYVLGNYIFLNEVDKGIHVIDNTNPSNPVNKYFIPIPGNVDLAVKGNVLYADMYRDLLAIDISNPMNVQVKSVIENTFPARIYNNGFVGDTSLVIVDWMKKDTTVTVQNNNRYLVLDNAVVLSTSGGGSANLQAPVGIGGSMARFTIMNNYLYTVTNMGLNVIDIAQPLQPVFNNLVQVGWRIETIYPFMNHLFIGSATGMFIYSTTNPAQPSLVSQFSHITACDPVIADSNYAYVTLRTGTNCVNGVNQLEILNIQNLQTPTLVKTYLLTNPHGLSKSGNALFICDGSGGLKVYNASDASNLQLLQTIPDINAYDIITINNNAIVVAKDGLYQYDITNPSNLILRSKIGL